MSKSRFPAPSKNGTPSQNPLEQRDKMADAVLFSKYDGLTTLWAEAENRLKKLRAPHAVWVTYNQDEFGREWESLGLDKYKGELRLLHTCDVDYGPEPEETERLPITDCPAYVRIDAAKYLKRLHERIVEAKEKFIPKVDEAMADIASVLQDI